MLIACAPARLDTKGALVSRRYFILVHILTPLGWVGYGSPGTKQDYHNVSLNLPSASTAFSHAALLIYIYILTTEKDRSQCLFVLSWQARNTGWRRTKIRKESLCGWFIGQPEQIAFLGAYLMVSHTDIRTNYVVNNPLPIIITLKQTKETLSLHTDKEQKSHIIQLTIISKVSPG